jgi:RNA polymerase sigma-70 factor (ECF subfamily)
MGRDLAEDLAQEVLVVLEEKYPGVVTLDELLPLSLQIVRFKMAGLRRKMQRHGEGMNVAADEAGLADTGMTPEMYAQQQELLDRLRAAIPHLGERCRELFRLKLLGRTFPEIQEKMGAASVNTVYTWDARCRERLLKMLGGRWEKS